MRKQPNPPPPDPEHWPLHQCHCPVLLHYEDNVPIALHMKADSKKIFNRLIRFWIYASTKTIQSPSNIFKKMSCRKYTTKSRSCNDAPIDLGNNRLHRYIPCHPKKQKNQHPIRWWFFWLLLLDLMGGLRINSPSYVCGPRQDRHPTKQVPILADRCTCCALASSATGSAQARSYRLRPLSR